MTTREEVTLLFEERRDAWLRGDLDAYLALWAEDMTGRRVEWWGMSVAEVQGGRIRRWREYWNPADVA